MKLANFVIFEILSITPNQRGIWSCILILSICHVPREIKSTINTGVYVYFYHKTMIYEVSIEHLELCNMQNIFHSALIHKQQAMQ